MGLVFKNDLHDEFGTWPIAYIPYGGADFGEIVEVGRAVGDGDDTAFYDAWVAAGDRLATAAMEAESSGHRESAQESYLRASAFYATAFHPIYGAPVDPRLIRAFRRQMDVFDKALSLFNPPVRTMRIPFEATTMPAYLIPAVGHAREVRPLLILTNGYDATITDMYFASAVAASRRGYHCLLFDGPGQGGMLYEQKVYLRPDWETVVKAVIDCAANLPLVDPARIALSGWSLGGYLAPRAASAERRLAACIADPGQWSMAGAFRQFAEKLGATPQAAANLGELDPAIVDRITQAVANNPGMRWKIIQRGFWVHGVDSMRDYLRAIEDFTMCGRAEAIACPTLIALAENDPLAASAQMFFDSLRCPKTLIRFSAAEGAGDHCEMGNRSLLNRRVLDWLDTKLAAI
jgi:alpha-beta hydrolase superfamily lysophospholipase